MASKEHEKKHKHAQKPARRGGSGKAGGKPANGPVFVIQKHDASHLHYDFRIEVDGILKSWAVPKGPSTDPREKRLAIPTEDHSLAYADFEGVIPADHYGGGTVLLWDQGTYENISKQDDEAVPISKALAQGHALIKLHGKKLTGGYALQRMGKGAEWLLIKIDDAEADARRNPVASEPKSVLSRRSIEEIAEEEGPEGSGK